MIQPLRLFFVPLLTVVIFSAPGYAQGDEEKAAIAHFMNLRFGMFIHWGPVTLRGTEIGWSRGGEVPTAEYDSLYKEFNPALFDADKWALTAKMAGMKYMVITARHHDGFCLWPSDFTDYDISSTPFKKDVVGELAKACKKYGLVFCIYYSILDWHHPDYPNHTAGFNENSIEDTTADMNKYVGYMKNQLKELITRYDPAMLWFDGEWEKPWTEERAIDLYTYLKALKKDILINNRIGKGRQNMSGTTKTGAFAGDFDTPEQQVGKINMTRPWESCITIANQWSWKPNDKMKSLQQCIQTLATTSGGNGNLLFNIGPMPDGRMEARQVTRLLEIGDWLKKNGEAVYGTMGGPFAPDSSMASTRKGNRIYIHLFKNPGGELVLPLLSKYKIRKAYFMNGTPLTVKQDDRFVKLALPAILPDAHDAVIVLELDGNVEHIETIKRT